MIEKSPKLQPSNKSASLDSDRNCSAGSESTRKNGCATKDQIKCTQGTTVGGKKIGQSQSYIALCFIKNIMDGKVHVTY